jgi:hypothetical protein
MEDFVGLRTVAEVMVKGASLYLPVFKTRIVGLGRIRN